MRQETAQGAGFEPVLRLRVLRKLRLAARRKIVVIHGKAGCGKSVALRQYLAGVQGQLAVFTPRSEYSDVAAVARGLAEALTPSIPSAARLLPSAFLSSRRQSEPWDSVALWLADQLTSPITIAIDQLHVLEGNERALQFLVRLIDASRRNVRWMLATRSTASLPLPRWLASGLADASVDDIALRVEAEDAVELASALHTNAAFVESLRTLHDGSIGAIFDGVTGADAAWRRFAKRGECLVALAAVPTIETSVLARLPAEASSLLDEMSLVIPFTQSSSPDAAVVHFGDTVRTRIFEIAHESNETESGLLLAARALEGVGRIDTALQLYVSARAHSDVIRILNQHGFRLHETGSADIVSSAIEALPVRDRREIAIALTLEAIDESYRGRYDVSESWFENALRLARDDEQRLRINLAFAEDLLRRGRADALERLEELSAIATNGPHSVSILAALATAHARAGRVAEARACVDRALAAVTSVEDVAMRALVHQRVAFVALMAGDADTAQMHAEHAATLAQEHGNDELIAVARSVSYVVAFSYKDDQTAALDALRQIGKASARLGNAIFRRFALIGSYMIHAERCETKALAELDTLLASEELEASLQHVEEGLMPARALQCAWSGDFDAAHQMLASSPERQTALETRALRWAEVALYAAVAMRDDDASTAVSNAQSELLAVAGDGSTDSLRAGLLVTLALMVLGRTGTASAFLETIASDVDRWPRFEPFYALLRSISQAHHHDYDAEALLSLMERMHDAGLGGWARLIASLPRTRLATLTGAR